MTTYTKRDLRAADMFAMTLFGLGILLLLIAAWPLLFGEASKSGGAGPGLWLLAGMFLLLGGALNLKIRQLVRNRGREAEDYPGVPE